MRNVLITGASTGIGYDVAKRLKERIGYRVFVTARKEGDIERLKKEGFFHVFKLDLADEENVESMAKQLLEQTDHDIYAVFHNGAYGQPGALEDITRSVLEQQFAANVFGWHQLTNLLIPAMRQKGEGRIIYNSSVLGIISLPFRGAYNASKYAIEGLADTLRLELADTHIKISLIEPGPIESCFRTNALAALSANVDMENSVHQEKYKGALARLQSEGNAPFTLQPKSVYKKVVHALESQKPKARYPVTFPTYLFTYLKRCLPIAVLDKFLLYVSKEENKSPAPKGE